MANYNHPTNDDYNNSFQDPYYNQCQSSATPDVSLLIGHIADPTHNNSVEHQYVYSQSAGNANSAHNVYSSAPLASSSTYGTGMNASPACVECGWAGSHCANPPCKIAYPSATGAAAYNNAPFQSAQYYDPNPTGMIGNTQIQAPLPTASPVQPNYGQAPALSLPTTPSPGNLAPGPYQAPTHQVQTPASSPQPQKPAKTHNGSALTAAWGSFGTSVAGVGTGIAALFDNK